MNGGYKIGTAALKKKIKSLNMCTRKTMSKLFKNFQNYSEMIRIDFIELS